jgi:hypothetical protein
VNGPEKCDGGATGSTALGACNPECSGFYEKKLLRITQGGYSGNLGGPQGADQICQAAIGNGWKALIVGGGRRATVTPLKGDAQNDWVIRKYTYYYNDSDQFVWRTDSVALLGVRDGQRMNLYADAFDGSSGKYPWGGYDNNWVEVPENDTAGTEAGTCYGWTTVVANGTFPLADLTMGRYEPCTSAVPLLCVQQ